MVWAIIALALVIVGGVFLYGKKRGKVDTIRDDLDDAKKKDEKDAAKDLKEKRANNAWDNLDATLDRSRERKTD